MAESLPPITVITPSYQQGRFLEATMRSVLGQGYPDLEYIVIDGGSTDESVSIIERYADRLAYWCSEPDEGQTQAVNKGLRRATGEVVGYLNSDDLLLPGALERIGRVYLDESVQATCGWDVAVDESGRILSKRVFPQPTAEVLLRRSLIPQDAVYWRRSVTEHIGLLDESFHMRMDMDYWVRMVQAGVVPRLIPSFLSAFRVHEQQKNRTDTEQVDAELMRILQRLHGPDADPQKLRKQISPWWRLRHRSMKKLAKLGMPSAPTLMPDRA